MADELTVAQCRRLLAQASDDELPPLLQSLASDERAGVRDAVARAGRRLERAHAEVSRIEALYATEDHLRMQGHVVIAGVDEVGRGAIAGPVTAGAVVLEPGTIIVGLDDSKRVPRERRAAIAKEIRSRAVAVSVAHTDAQRIDEVGIVAATRESMHAALRALDVEVDHVLIDGNTASLSLSCTAVVGGDARCAAIAAASIVAKVERDSLMVKLADEYPGYGLDEHRGYCTQEHVCAVADLGPSRIHRLSFEPCRDRPTLF